MGIEMRVAKLEADVESVKEMARMNASAISRLEARMDQGFTELRKEMNTNFRWLAGITLTSALFLLGLMGRIAGLY